MTREELIKIFKEWKRRDEELLNQADTLENIEIYDSTIQALEQDTVPFNFELYQAGLMDIPKGMIEVLDNIRDEIIQVANEEKVHDERWALGLKYATKIIDKYKAESEK